MTLGSPSGPRGRWAILAALAVFVAIVAGVAWTRRATPARPPTLADAGWDLTSDGDFETSAVDFVGPRLRLSAATRHTRPDSVKFLGARRRDEVRLAEGSRVSADLDWNNQANGSGLSAGIVLAPAATSGNPLESASCLWVEYIGIPPGRNARMVVGTRESGQSRLLHTEGWPDSNREGRAIGLQRIEIVIGKGGSFRVLENGSEVYASAPNALSFDRARLYLQMSSRSNYPPREVFFDNVKVEAGK